MPSLVRRLAFSSVVVLAAALLTAPPAFAATLVVTSAADGSDAVCDATCTIADAFAVANGNLGDDTITFAAALNGVPVVSTTMLQVSNGTITLTGNGTSSTVVAAALRAESSATLSINDLTVQLSGSGPAIESLHATVSATNVVVADGGVGVHSGSSTAPAAVGLTNVVISADGFDANSGNTGVTTVTLDDVTVSAGGINLNSGNTSITTGTLTDVEITGGGANFNSEDTSTTAVTATGFDLRGGGLLNTDGGGTSVDLTDATVTGSTGDGINHNGDTLTLTDSTVSDNAGDGVFVPSSGTNLTLTRSTVINNTGKGVEVSNSSAGEVTIASSTVRGNGVGVAVCSPTTVALKASLVAANDSAGVVVDCSTSAVTVTNSTVSGNATGVESYGSATISNSTITANTLRGIVTYNSVTVLSSIIAGNAADCLVDSGTITSGGHNVTTSAAPACGAAAAGDQVVADVALGALEDNGGPTQTHLPSATSAAVDAGAATSCPATDQRGAVRPQDGDNDGTAVCDVGAVERAGRAAVPPSANAGPNKTAVEGAAIALAGTVRDADGDAVTAAWTYAPQSGVDAGAGCVFTRPESPTTTVRCSDDGVYVVTLTATDGDGAHSDTATLFLANAKPRWKQSSPGAVSTYNRKAKVRVKGAASDAGANDARRCVITWGDGKRSTITARSTCAASHKYARPGVYKTTTRVRDDDGGTSRVIRRVVAVCQNKIPAAGVTLRGTNRRDILCGGPRVDMINGRGGDDAVFGGAGRDTLRGGAGGDTLYGGDGNDHLHGDKGRDTLHGLHGGDVLHACDGVRDKLVGSKGRDVAYADKGLDGFRSVEKRRRCD